HISLPVALTVRSACWRAFQRPGILVTHGWRGQGAARPGTVVCVRKLAPAVSRVDGRQPASADEQVIWGSSEPIVEGVEPMGRGRAKAKQQKVARKLKYSTGGTDLDRLRSELGVAEGGGSSSGPSG